MTTLINLQLIQLNHNLKLLSRGKGKAYKNKIVVLIQRDCHGRKNSAMTRRVNDISNFGQKDINLGAWEEGEVGFFFFSSRPIGDN